MNVIVVPTATAVTRTTTTTQTRLTIRMPVKHGVLDGVATKIMAITAITTTATDAMKAVAARALRIQTQPSSCPSDSIVRAVRSWRVATILSGTRSRIS